MLEEMAFKFVILSEDALRVLSYGLTILGGIIAGIFARGNNSIARAPYFAYSALIFFLVSLVQVLWLFSIPAILGGYLSILVIISCGAAIIGGLFYGRIAMGRSRDAYGHGRMAILAFIPIANLWLLLTPSRNSVSAQPASAAPLLKGGWGVLTGFGLFMAASMVTVLFEQQADRIMSQAGADTVSQEQSIELLVRTRGIEEALHLIATEAQTPITVDEVTILSRIEAHGHQLRRTYVVSMDHVMIGDKFRVTSTNSICTHPPFLVLLRAGVTIREVYVKSDGSPIGDILIAQEDCGV